jgi:uncharacterized protein
MKTKFYSYATGALPRGCLLCVQGKKSVLFVTGICRTRCFYCPISDQKNQKDVIYINEWPTRLTKDIFTEIRLCSSEGVGITGGDPLARFARTVRLIKLFKKRYGKKFHIHLYTPLTLVTKERLRQLHRAGLDEIRFHPDIAKPREWKRIELAALDWDVGVEIPVIPGSEEGARKLIDYLVGKVGFLNLNELELSDTNANQLRQKGFRTKDRLSYGVKGSHELALRLYRYARAKGIRTHYCTAKLKDAVQLRNRMKLRARNAARSFDAITTDGMLVRGAIYCSGNLRRTLYRLQLRSEAPMALDEPRKRILAPVYYVRKQAAELKENGLTPAIVEEYPTFDCLNVVTDFL